MSHAPVIEVFFNGDLQKEINGDLQKEIVAKFGPLSEKFADPSFSLRQFHDAMICLFLNSV